MRVPTRPYPMQSARLQLDESYQPRLYLVPKVRSVTIRCLSCRFEATATGDTDGIATGRAVAQISNHIVREHNGSAA